MQISQNQYAKLTQGHKMTVYLSPPEDDDIRYMPPDHNIVINSSSGIQLNTLSLVAGKSLVEMINTNTQTQLVTIN